ncbi:ubiquinol-cytochrome c reductase iron-sulfur subunit [Kordiimonas lipolytica]|uniref:Ubiquinol-cytochrome c reductase iron-sulfur subunit n=1 Tax=Kordiimonas lipolytica TaxID=1662421 RepID=A0ABV8U9G1_9PROT|nr:ubiquinol-cytochrome c reductase iron-sulfur subunit [Kordiimonas lipolytica]
MSTINETIEGEEGATRRDFLHVAATGLGGVGAVMAAWPFIDQMNPAADTLALATVEVDLSAIGVGEAIKVMWQGKPIFIRHRTAKEIEEARSVDMSELVDKQTDAERVQEGRAEWLVVTGICTHLGCVPVGTSDGEDKGDFGGWFCPCHGSHYDTAGRIRKGPAPKNLAVPTYAFLNDTTLQIG